jgi:hypothetical protein
MKLGIWTNSEDATVDYVCSKKPNTVEIIRFDSDVAFPVTLSKDANSKLNELDVLWHRRPFENAFLSDSIDDKIAFSEKEESLWNFMLQVPKEKWLNFPTLNWFADKKIEQLIRANDCGLATPDWILTNNQESAKIFLNKYNWNCIIKPINCGYFVSNNDIYHIYTNETSKGNIDLSLISKCPTYFQNKINKNIDVRTLYLNGKTIFIGISGGKLDVRRNEMKGVHYKFINPPQNIVNAYQKMMLLNGLRFCTSDFVVSEENQWFFLENNPNGQWVWMDEYLEGAIVDFFFENLRGV